MDYYDLPDKVFVAGEVTDGSLSCDVEYDANGNYWIGVWSDFSQCEKFTKLYNYKRGISEIERGNLSSLIYNANIDDQIKESFSYVYFNPDAENLNNDMVIIDTDKSNVIDVCNSMDYIVDIDNVYADLHSKIAETTERVKATCADMLQTQEESDAILGEIAVDLDEVGSILANVNSLTEAQRSERYITKSVRREVWERDKGRCVNCGSTSKIEFDHIIPVYRGGSNSAKNIELLCQICNRGKSSKEPGFH